MIFQTEIKGGGTTPAVQKYKVTVIDYDGTVITEQLVDSGSTFTLPAAPTTHSRLTFQGWVSPVPVSNGQITVDNQDIVVGASYKTVTGKTEFDITLTTASGLTFTCNMSGNKDWGDGTTDSLTSHTYATAGDYTIVCDGNTIPYGVFGQSWSAINYTCKEIRIGNSVEVQSSAFQVCQGLKAIVIPDSSAMGSSMCDSCYNLNAVVLPYGIGNPGDYCFSGCQNMNYIVLPYGLTYIGYQFLHGCVRLETICIPSTVTNFGEGAFQDCRSVNKIIIPTGTISIPQFMLESCYSLEEIIIPNTVTSIGGAVTRACRSLKTITYPSSVTSIGNQQTNNSGVQTIIMSPTSSITFADNVFDESPCLTNITMPLTTEIPNNFAVYSPIKSVVIPNGVTTIGTQAYMGATPSVISFPASVSLIKAWCIGGASLTEMDFSNHTSVPTIEADAFFELNSTLKIKVPSALYNSWIAATNWSAYANYIEAV